MESNMILKKDKNILAEEEVVAEDDLRRRLWRRCR